MFGKLGLSKGLAQGRRLVLTLAPVVTQPRTTFYVDATAGNDANDGSPGSPWKSLGKVNTFVNSTALPGTEIRLTGDFSQEYFEIDSFRGTSSAPLRITSTTNAKIGGALLLNTSYVKVSLLEFAGLGVEDSNNGAAFALINQNGMPDCEGNEISYCSIHDYGSAAITFGAFDNENEFTTGRIVGFVADHNVIARCHGGGPYEDGYDTAVIEGWGNYGLNQAPNASLYQCKITNNIISDCPGWNPDPVDNSVNTGSAIKLGSAEECLIQWNQATNCGSEEARRGVGMWFWDSKNCVLANNSVVGQRTGSDVDGCGFDIDGGCQNCIMEYNFATDCDGPGAVLWQFNDTDGYILDPIGNVVRFNMLIRNNKRNNTYAFGIGGDMNCVNSADVHNNTIVHAVAGGEGMNLRTKGAATIKSANNIIYLEGAGSYGLRMYPDNGGSFLSGGNLFYSGGADVKFSWGSTIFNTLALYQAAGHDPYSLTGNPAFVNVTGDEAEDFKVTSGSAANGHGLDLSSFGINDGGKDYFGTNIDAARRSMGAYQSPFDMPAALTSGWNTTALQASSMIFSNDNKTVNNNNTANVDARVVYSLASATEGAWYASVKIEAYEYGNVGLINDDNTKFIAYQWDGAVISSSGGYGNIGAYSAPGVVDITFNLTGTKVWFRLNGGNWNGDPTYDPETGIGGYTIPPSATPWHIGAYMPYYADTQRTLCAETADFVYPAPAGFTQFAEA